MSKSVRVGIVGVGRLGYQHAQNLATIPGSKLVAVCDMDEARAKEAAAKLEVPEVYTDFEQMLNDANLDAVAIANTTSEHCKAIVGACKAKLHIWCEKPTGVNKEELDIIDEAVAGNPGKVFQVGFVRRYDFHNAVAKKKIEDGEIGDVIKVRSISRDPAKYREFYAKFGPTSGGLFVDMSIHDLDLVRWYAGSEVESVYSIGGVFAFPEFKEFGDIDNATIVMKFKNGVMGEVESCKNSTCGYDVWVEVVGTKGSLRVAPTPYSSVVVSDEKGFREDACPWFHERFEGAFRNELVEFIECIREGRESKIGAEDARKSIELSFLAKESFDKKELICV